VGKTLLVTGSCGLIGSETVTTLASQFQKVVGLDNNMRADFFGPKGTVLKVRDDLISNLKNYLHFDTDIRDRNAVLGLFKEHRPDAVVHCAAQPSHDLAASRPFDDFDVNAVGTLNLLESCRQFAGDSPFVFLSTNKVYGSTPDELPLKELETRFDYAAECDFNGISEQMSVDQTLHSLFGSSKVAADILVQEYGRYFNLPTVCFRGGCLTGARHSGVELHGFLSYLVKCAVAGTSYRIIGYKGKQVRDQIDSSDVVSAIQAFIEKPKAGAVYNLGGGRQNSASILECINLIDSILGKKLKYDFIDQNRVGDHICYISDLRKFKSDYPEWGISKSLEWIINSIVTAESK